MENLTEKSISDIDIATLFKDMAIPQLYIIICEKSTDTLNFIDVFDKCGEYKIVIKNFNKIGRVQYVFLNSTFKVEEIKEVLDEAKQDGDIFMILGLPVDMMLLIEDIDIRQWCLKKQEENIKLITKILEENSQYI